MLLTGFRHFYIRAVSCFCDTAHPIGVQSCVLYDVCVWKLEKEIYVTKKYTLSYAKTSVKTKSNLLQLFLKQINGGLNMVLGKLDNRCFKYIILIC
jgi:hypothetical protein